MTRELKKTAQVVMSFSLARRTLMYNEQRVCYMSRLSASRMKLFPAHYESTVGETRKLLQ